LVCEGEKLVHLIAALVNVIAAIESRIRPNMAGDIVATEAPIGAARRIQERNEDEVLRVR
jgi:hypothetical protein